MLYPLSYRREGERPPLPTTEHLPELATTTTYPTSLSAEPRAEQA